MSLDTFPRALSDGEWVFYSRTFPNLQRRNVTVLGPKKQRFNCISWSLGFEDRWIDVGDNKTALVNLCKLYIGQRSRSLRIVVDAHYYYIGCDTASAAIDVYAVGQVPKHAAKLESAATCTSKMQVQNKLRHNRQELEDSRPTASYGIIYGHFMKDAKHPGNNDPTLPEPDHPNNHELPPVLPVGHPEGRPPITPVLPQPHNTVHPSPATTHPAASATAHLSPPASTHPAAPATHPAASTTHSTQSAPPAHHSTGRPPLGVSRKAVSNMRPYDPIPPPAEATLSTVHQLHTSLSKTYTPAVTNFESLYAAWKATWFSPEMELEPKYEIPRDQTTNSLTNRICSSSARAKGPAFDALVKLGPAIIPLVVHKLAEPDEFFAVQLCKTFALSSVVKDSLVLALQTTPSRRTPW